MSSLIESSSSSSSIEIDLSSHIKSNNVLNELDDTESEIFRLLEISKETIIELQKIPNCDEDYLQSLSIEYFNLATSIKDKIKFHAKGLLSPYAGYTIGNYNLNKDVEIDNALKRLVQEEEDNEEKDIIIITKENENSFNVNK
jgi:hypothetical protein